MLKLKYLIENFELTKYILNYWNFDEDTLDEYLQYYRISSNAVFPFSWEGRGYILRYAPVEEKKYNNLLAEQDFLEYLKRNGFPALQLVPDKKGNKLNRIETSWGEYYACVFLRVNGNSLDELTVDCHIMEQYGKTLGALHKLSEDCPELQADNQDDVFHEIETCLKQYHAPKLILDEYLSVKEEMSKLKRNKHNYGIVHFDFEPDNVFFDQEKDCCNVIDFEDMMYHFYAMDIAKALDAILEEYGTDHYHEYEAAFLKGYETQHNCSEEMKNSLQLMSRFEQLYKYAGSLRCMAEVMDHEPDWMQEIREKLKNVNNKIESNIMRDQQLA